MKPYWVVAFLVCCGASRTLQAASGAHVDSEMARPAWGFDARAGLALATRLVSSSTNLYEEPQRWGGPALTLGAGARWVIPTGARRWSVGPELGSALLVSRGPYPLFVDLDLVFMFEAFTEPRLRGFFSAGAGPSWNNTAIAPHSFDVQREVTSAFGFHGFLGYGLERRLTRGRAFTLETRLELHSGYVHEHKMTQLATGAVAYSQDSVSAFTAGVMFGFRFWR